MKAVKAWHRYEYATIAQHFHYGIDQIAALTPRKRRELLFHARDERGQLVQPRDESAVPSEAGLQLLLAMLSGGAGLPELPPGMRKGAGNGV
jgi:hypothetical protein